MSKTHKITQLKKRIAELERKNASCADAEKGMVCLYMCLYGLPGDSAIHNKYLVPADSPAAKDLKAFIEMGSRLFAEDIEAAENARES